ncbi:unnamed protein product [Caenorhabditis angaria]|uniref:Uncharacterized protein n=1 Tax=Caenorhabditis angaria TaxID=860376 RepID=A0A9P1N7J6_9PELO|nr:unnamed protein product [Caenorhabditis angaria]
MSRYTSSYTPSSRYDRGDYSSSSYLSGSRRTPSTRSSTTSSTYTPRSYDSSTNPYSSYTSKYGDYSSSKYSSSAKKTMEDSTAPIVQDEVKELDYEIVPPTEVLQESQIEEFDEEKQVEPEVEEAEEDFEEQNVAEEVVDEEEQVEEEAEPEPEPIREPTPEPQVVKVQKVAPVDENRTPSPTVLNAKKLGGIPWPPKDEDEQIESKKNNNIDTENVPKKRVSDLIARFNQGKVDNEAKKNDSSYKSEYGAGTNVGKVATHNFA